MAEGCRRTYLLEHLKDVLRPLMPILPCDAAAAQ
jgi:hypothetical protein